MVTFATLVVLVFASATAGALTDVVTEDCDPIGSTIPCTITVTHIVAASPSGCDASGCFVDQTCNGTASVLVGAVWTAKFNCNGTPGLISQTCPSDVPERTAGACSRSFSRTVQINQGECFFFLLGGYVTMTTAIATYILSVIYACVDGANNVSVYQ